MVEKRVSNEMYGNEKRYSLNDECTFKLCFSCIDMITIAFCWFGEKIHLRKIPVPAVMMMSH